jgi:hypothetical protein
MTAEGTVGAPTCLVWYLLPIFQAQTHDMDILCIIFWKILVFWRIFYTGCPESPKALGKQVLTQLFLIVHTSS